VTRTDNAEFKEMFAGGDDASKRLAPQYSSLADEAGCGFFDAGTVATTTPLDGVHLDAENTRRIGQALAPLVRVNAVAPATVVKGSTMFPRDRVMASLVKYAIPYREDETTESLREKLADFYAKRSLIQVPIEPEDQAEAIFLLVSRRLSKTTGHVVPVDGGLRDGFLR